jgi:aryl-alcohol dehydrogenase-like predicted oxidoreductase
VTPPDQPVDPPADQPVDPAAARTARLGLGLAALGRPSYINLGRDGVHHSVEQMRARSHDALDAAHAAGVRWFDAARSYGRAEEFLGGWLAERAPDDVTVSSKWGYRYTADWRPDAEVHEVKEHTLEHFRTQWAQSRELLGDAIALYQVHSLTVDSPLFDDTPLQAALAALADEGVRVGFSTSGPRQADAVRRGLALAVDGVPVFTAVQATWNVLEPSVAGALAEAHEAGAHVLVKEPVANGRLVVAPPDAVATIAAHHGVGPDAIALAAALDRPWAGTVLLGAADTDQLASNLATTTVTLTDADREALGALAEPPEQYWGTRSSLAWT